MEKMRCCNMCDIDMMAPAMYRTGLSCLPRADNVLACCFF